MYRSALLSLLVGLVVLASGPAPVHAQAGQICLFADEQGTTCNLSDSGPGLLQVHVIHMGAPSASSVSFMAPKPACMAGATWLSDNPGQNLVIGDSQTGVAVSYGACVASPYHVMTITYEVTGGTTPGCAYPVLPYPGNPYVEVVECPSRLRYGMGGTTYINSTAACSCTELESPATLDVTPTNLLYLADDVTKTAAVTNLGDQSLTWTAQWSEPWLSVSPASGTNDATLTLVVDRTGVDIGHYKDRVDIVSNGGTKSILVDMRVVSQDPVLSVSPTSLDFGTTDVAKNVSINNLGIDPLNWTISETIPWLGVVPTSGTDDATVSVRVDRSGMAAGTYTGTITVNSNGGIATVDVSMTVPQPPILSVSPAGLDFGIQETGLPLTISNDGNGTLSWMISESAPWISVSPAMGTNDRVVSVAVYRSGLSGGVHVDTLHVTSNGGNIAVPVTAEVAPLLSVSPTSIDFGDTETGWYLAIHNQGQLTLEWSVSESLPWLSVSPATGTGDGSVLLTVDRTGLPIGTYTGTVDVTSNGGDATVDVSMNVPPPPALAVSPSSLDFGIKALLLPLYIENTGGPGLDWTITENIPWLSTSPSAGTDNQQVDVLVDRIGLPNGVYTDSLHVSSNAGSAVVPVTVTQQPVLLVTPTSLDFFNTTTGTFSVLNDGSGRLTWSITASEPWVQLSQTSGTDNAAITVTIDTGGLANGDYTAVASVTSDGGNQDVTLSVHLGAELVVSPTSLFFTAVDTVKTLSISNAATGTLNWNVTPGAPWVSVTPTSGTGDALITVNVYPDSLGLGTFNTVLSITSNGGNQDVGVTYSEQTPPSGYGGRIVMYGDADYTMGYLADSQVGLQTVYIRHEGYPDINASRFRVVSHGYTGTWISDNYLGNLAIGDSQTGLALSYTACKSSPYPIVNVMYFGLGTTPWNSGAYLEVVPDPSATSGVIEAVDCSFHLLQASGSTLPVNEYPTVGTEGANWSKIKGMYRKQPKPAPDDGKK